MHSPPLSRTYSDKYIAGNSDVDLFQNKNTDWTGARFTHIFYILFIFIFWVLLHMSQLFSAEDCWTAVNVTHGWITFILFHWIKGSPDDSTQGAYNGHTLYEQMDAGVPWTATKKFLMLMPTLLTWMACHMADYKPLYICVNCGIFLIVIVAKMPQMHGVRILGINSTLGYEIPLDINDNKKES